MSPRRVVLRVPVMRRRPRGMGFAFPTGYQLGACPMNADGTCGPGHDTDCTQIRECDDRTGKIHFEYVLPGERANADINNYDPSTGQVFYTDASGSRVTTPMGIPVPTQAQVTNPWSNPILTLRSPAVAPTPPPAAGGSGAGSGSGGGSRSGSGAGAGGSGGSGGGSGGSGGAGGGSGAGFTLADLLAALKGSGGSTSAGSGFLTSSVSVFGASVPVWALGLAGVVGVMALGGKR